MPLSRNEGHREGISKPGTRTPASKPQIETVRPERRTEKGAAKPDRPQPLPHEHEPQATIKQGSSRARP